MNPFHTILLLVIMAGIIVIIKKHNVGHGLIAAIVCVIVLFLIMFLADNEENLIGF
jgi:hypothetical protein